MKLPKDPNKRKRVLDLVCPGNQPLMEILFRLALPQEGDEVDTTMLNQQLVVPLLNTILSRMLKGAMDELAAELSDESLKQIMGVFRTEQQARSRNRMLGAVLETKGHPISPPEG